MLLSFKNLNFCSLTTFSMVLESMVSMEMDRSFEILVSRSFLKIVLTFASLKALGNLFKDIERLQISVPCIARTLAPSFINLPGSLPLPPTFEVLISPQNFKYIIFFLLVVIQIF